MINSWCENAIYTCYSCEEKSSVSYWTIIDVSEKPDLLERVRNWTIHEVICPNCGESYYPDLPLLLYFPGDEPRFLFASRPANPEFMPGYPELKIRGMFDQLVESSDDQELAESYVNNF